MMQQQNKQRHFDRSPELFFAFFFIFNEPIPEALGSNGSGGGSVNGQLATSNLGRDREESSGGERGQGTSQASDGF